MKRKEKKKKVSSDKRSGKIKAFANKDEENMQTSWPLWSSQDASSNRKIIIVNENV